jgi:hypothetical protein
MLYNNSSVVNLSKSELLSIVDEMEIYAYFLGFKPLLNQIYISPLRDDKSPSFSLFLAKNGRILYKDFGTGKSGDCIELAKEITKLSTKDIVTEILQLLSNKLTTQYQRKKLRKIPSTNTNIEIKSISFNEEGLSYWKQYGIEESDLIKHEVFQVSKVWINDQIKFTYKLGTPIFAYKLYDRFKIYIPGNKLYRFTTNANVYYIQGWKQLDRTKETLIITKALKDVMVLNRLGYASIAPNSESYSLPDNIIKEITSTYNKIIVLYDRDKAGMLSARKLFKTHGFDFKFIPSKFNTKDISDFRKFYGEQPTVKLLSKLLTT